MCINVLVQFCPLKQFLATLPSRREMLERNNFLEVNFPKWNAHMFFVVIRRVHIIFPEWQWCARDFLGKQSMTNKERQPVLEDYLSVPVARFRVKLTKKRISTEDENSGIGRQVCTAFTPPSRTFRMELQGDGLALHECLPIIRNVFATCKCASWAYQVLKACSYQKCALGMPGWGKDDFVASLYQDQPWRPVQTSYDILK